MEVHKKAVDNVVEALSLDGQEWVLNSGRVIVLYPTRATAERLIKEGWFDDWVRDEEFYLRSVVDS